MLVKIFSWSLVICLIIFIFLNILIVNMEPFKLYPYFNLVIVIAIISSIGLLITLIIERIKKRKEDNDAINKY